MVQYRILHAQKSYVMRERESDMDDLVAETEASLFDGRVERIE